MVNVPAGQQTKNKTLWIALAMTLLATAWMAYNDQEPAELPVPVQRKAVPPAVAQRSDMAALRMGGHAGNSQGAESGLVQASYQRARISHAPLPLFSSQTEVVAGSAANTVETPQVPALPFTYAGKMTEDGRYTVFLLSGARSLAVSKGDVVEDAWRVKSIKPPVMVFTYLPLRMESSLDIGSATTIGESN